MARIQILELPSQQVGDYYRTPFALVIDQVASETTEVHGHGDTQPIRVETTAELTQEEADALATRVGAVGAILTACSLDIA